MNAGRPLPDSEHDTDWRGFQYDPRGYFQREWLSLGPDVDTSTIMPNGDPASVDPSLDTLGRNIDAAPWDQHRETNVGGLTAIVNPDTREELWASTKARDPGHRLSEVRVDFTTYGITHDDAGRLTHGLDADFVYDPNNRLSAALGAQKEFYLYTADGDLAAVGRGIGRDEVFAYDGAQMIASYDADTGAPLWEATWGDGIDQLVEYRDFAAASPVVPIVDHRNSAVATWNPAAIAVEQLARYDAHGRLTLLDATESQLCVEQGNPGVVCSAPSGMPFAFNGRWRSPVTGLVNMRARWYSPRLGQFTAPDPLGYFDVYSLFGFAKFDPINGWDPWGLSKCPMAGGCPQSQNRVPFHGSGFGLPESVRGDLPSGPTIDRARKQAAARNPGGYAKGIARGLLVDWLTGTPFGWAVQVLTTSSDAEGSQFVDALVFGPQGDAESLGFDTSTLLNPVFWWKRVWPYSKPGAKLRYKLGPNDLDWRGTGKNWRDALDEAFKKTGVPKEKFSVTKWGTDANGKSVPVEWTGPRAEVSMDFPHTTNGPDAPHVGWKSGKKSTKQVGHIILEHVPAGRAPNK